MFILFRHNYIDGNCFKRKKQLKNISKSEIRTVRTDGSLPFYITEIPIVRGSVLWKGIDGKCGKLASRVVASREISIPDGLPIKRYASTLLMPEIIFNTALEALKTSHLKPDSFSLTLTDRKGLVASKVCELLPFCSEIRVVTGSPEKYAQPVADALSNSGAVLIIRDSHRASAKPEIVICTDGAVAPSMNGCAVFAHRKYVGGKLMLTGGEITLCEKHRDIVPDYISPMDFAGALTELCASADYDNAVFSDTEINSSACRAEEFARALFSFVSDNSNNT